MICNVSLNMQFYLENGGKHATDEGSKFIPKCNRKVYKQHEVAVSDVGGVLGILGRVNKLGHELLKMVDSLHRRS